MEYKLFYYKGKNYIQKHIPIKFIQPVPCSYCDLYKNNGNVSCDKANLNYWDFCGPTIALEELEEGL